MNCQDLYSCTVESTLLGVRQIVNLFGVILFSPNSYNKYLQNREKQAVREDLGF